MKRVFTYAILLLCFVSLKSFAISGEVKGTWTKGSTVNVDGQINVPKGESLTIEEGVTIIISDKGFGGNDTKIEFLVFGNLYCYGTKDNPVTFTVPEAARSNEPDRVWGGIICGPNSAEVVLDNTIVEYTGAITTADSPSVVSGLFKAGGGEGMVAFNTNNVNGKYVVVNSTFRFTGEDAIYVQGGKCIFANNLIYGQGITGGEAINVKAGCMVDAANNLIFSPNTNGFKLSGAGKSEERQILPIKAYNNTMINAGWRRDPSGIKGGSVYIEKEAIAYVFNNIIHNCMFGVKLLADADPSCVVDYNYYVSGTQQSAVPQHIAAGITTAFNGFYKNDDDKNLKEVTNGENDVYSASAGDAAKDPKFENYSINVVDLFEEVYDYAWDFHLQAGSPALTGANNSNTGIYAPNFAAEGLTLNGKTYKSPFPSSYFGALGSKSTKVGINKISADKFNVYPNPVEDVININGIKDGNFSIFSISGQKVLAGIISASNARIDVSKLQAGIYVINMNGSVARFIKK